MKGSFRLPFYLGLLIISICCSGCGSSGSSGENDYAGGNNPAGGDNLAGAIEFVSATPNLIGLSGTTNATTLPSQSTIEFIVKDNQTNPVYNQTVTFALTTSTGGLTLEPTSAQTDIEGKVKVVVQSGNVPTSVRVKATVDNTTLSTLSSELVLSTGFPDQNSFSISADIMNPEAMAYDGEVVNITVRAADSNNNPAPCLLYTSPSPRDVEESRMPSSA